MKVHILGHPCVPADRKLTADAFNQLAFRLADLLPLQGVPVVLYGSEHGSYEENRLRTNSETETAPRAESVFVETLKIEDFFPVVGLMEKLGGYMGFNSGEYLSPSQDSSIQAQQNLLRRL